MFRVPFLLADPCRQLKAGGAKHKATQSCAKTLLNKFAMQPGHVSRINQTRTMDQKSQ